MNELSLILTWLQAECDPESVNTVHGQIKAYIIIKLQLQLNYIHSLLAPHLFQPYICEVTATPHSPNQLGADATEL